MKMKRLIGIAIAILIFIVASLVLLGFRRQHQSLPVAFSLPRGASYERGGRCLLQRSAEGVSVADGSGATVPLGNWNEVTGHGGVLFCEDEDGETAHFALNGRNGGVWVENHNFFDDHITVTSFGAASLIPQSDKRTGKLGYLNRQMLWTVSPKYQVPIESGGEWDLRFSNGTAFPTLATEHGEKLCMLTEDGEETILRIQNGEPSERRFQCGFCLFRKKEYVYDPKTGLYQDIERCNFLSEDNVVLVKNSQYDDAHDFSEGYAAVHTDAGWGYIDTTGQEVLPCIYNGAGDFHDGKAMVSTKTEGAFFIDPQGTPISAPMAGCLYSGKEGGGLYCVTLPQKGTHLIDASGKQITDRQLYDYTWDEDDSVWYASSGGEYYHDWLITPTGVQLHNKDNLLFQIYGDRCIVGDKGVDVLYDLTTGRKLFSARVIDGFREGLSYAGSLKCGYIDQDGNWVIPPVLPRQERRYITSAGESFEGGLVLANYSGETVMLYNPLIYKDGWSQNEFERALSLGLGDSSMSQEQLTADQLLTLVEDFEAFVLGHLTDGVFPDEPAFRSRADYLIGTSEETVSREALAVCLCRLAEDLGMPTKHYIGFYADQDALSYPSEVNYIASLALFDVDNNTFDPQGSVSQREAATLFLRFTEAML